MEIKNTTPIHVLIALCFMAVTLLCMQNIWFPCFYLSVLIICLYMALGARRAGRLDPVFFLFPICSFFAAWVLGFTLTQKYAMLFKGRAPEFLILGFHPSFFWIMLLYWLAGFVILGAGFKLLSSRWMTSEDWNDFKQKIDAIEKKQR